MKTVLINPGSTPSTFGLLQEDDDVYIITGCCGKKFDETAGFPWLTDEETDDKDMKGASNGCIRLTCPCGKKYKGYTDFQRSVDQLRYGPGWLETWTNLQDVKIEVEE